ncbi:DUF724 domain-containing protein 6-like [Euphorbia lathyris]|uniref:DUF724 domain-containing protein 6-like n=1 Tax=Euphorbia lathyris TaxID=212925 RepID=UPI003313AFBB
MGRIARRGPKAIPIIDKERKDKFRFLKVNAAVEVTSDEEGFRGAWYEAKVLNTYRKNKISVQYQSLLSDDYPDELLIEDVDISFIRPAPPPSAAKQIYEPYDVVDAFHRDGWWTGVVSKVDVRKRKKKLRRKYTVVFENPSEQWDFNGGLLRFHHVWMFGRWVRHPKKKEIPNIIPREEEEKEKGGGDALAREEGENEESADEDEDDEEEEEELACEEEEEEVLAREEEENEESAREEEENEESADADEEEEEELAREEDEEEEEEESAREEDEEEEESAREEEKEESADEDENEEEESKHVSVKGSRTSCNHGKERYYVRKSRKNSLEQSTSPITTSTSKKQKIPAPEIKETLPNSSNHLSPDECRAASMLINSTEQVTDSTITRDLQLAGSNSLNKGKNFVVPCRTECEEQSARVSLKGSSGADNHSEIKKSRKNPVEHSSPFCATSTNKKQKMPAPETKETLPNCSNELRTENSTDVLPSPDECQVTLMSLNSSERVTDNARTNGDGMAQSSKETERGLNAQVTGQQVPTAAGEDETNEDPIEVINVENYESLNQSANVEAESESAWTENLPFRKSSFLWKHFDSLEVFQILPQNPHFIPLLDCNEETREGAAIGHMWTFVSVVEKVTKLRIDDPMTLIHSYLKALDILESVGFDVKALVDCIEELLILKLKQEKLENQSKRYQSLVAECDENKVKLQQEISAIDKMMCELKEQRALKVLQMMKEDSTREFLQLEVSSIKDAMFGLEQKFKVKSTVPWRSY